MSSEYASSSGDLEEDTVRQEEQSDSSHPVYDSPPENSQKEKQEPDFDSCPSDTYVLWEKNGISYIITIEVFCDPIQNKLNLGCPAPFDSTTQSSVSCEISSGL
jgi:hypothetical protein